LQVHPRSDIWDSLTVDLGGLPDLSKDSEDLVQLQCLRGCSPRCIITTPGLPQLESLLAFSTLCKFRAGLLDCALLAEAGETVIVAARELSGICKDFQADTTAHLLLELLEDSFFDSVGFALISPKLIEDFILS